VPSLDESSYANGHPAKLEQIFSHSELFKISELLSVQSVKTAQVNLNGRQKFRKKLEKDLGIESKEDLKRIFSSLIRKA